MDQPINSKRPQYGRGRWKTAIGRSARLTLVSALVLSLTTVAFIAGPIEVGAVGSPSAEFLGGTGPLAGAIFEAGDNPNYQYVDDVLATLAQAQARPAEQRQTRHWNPAQTAMNNGGASQGDALELTWSIIPDGTRVIGYADEPDCESTLVASLDAAYGAGKWQAEMEKVWADWTRLTGNVYTPAVLPDANGTPLEAVPAATWGLDPSSPGIEDVQGDIRIGGCSIDGASGTNTLAYNFYPPNGDMKIDTDNLAGLGLTTDFHNVFSHEHGHGAGLAHVCPVNQTKLMEPFLNSEFIGLQHDDIRGVQRGYGDRFEKINAPNDTPAAATVLDPLTPTGGQTELQLSLDSTLDEDWFQFPGIAGNTLDVTVAPNGLSYLEGPVDGAGACGAGTLLNSLALQNLSFEIRNAGGALRVVNATSAGSPESTTGFLIPTTGTYYVRVLGIGIDDAQLYDLTVNQTTKITPVADISITNTDGVTAAVAGTDTLTYALLVANKGPQADPVVSVAAAFPAGLTCASTAAATGGASGNTRSGVGNIADVLSMPSNSTVSYAVTCSIAASMTGTVSTTATAKGSLHDPNTSNNSATDADTVIVPPRSLSISPARLYESRSGASDKTFDGAQQGVGRTLAGKFATIKVTGRAGVPDNATAVFLNVVAANPSRPGYLTVFPCGTKQPLASNVNYNGNDISFNAVLAKIGTNGNVCVYTSADTDLIIDVNGYVPASGSPNPISPARLYESRSGASDKTFDGAQQGVGRTLAGKTATINITGRAGVPNNATAVFLNVVAANPSRPGYLTVFPCGTKQPLASNVNYNGNDIRSNAVLAKIGTNGNVCVYTSADTDLIIDVNGYVPASGSPNPISPARLYESRSGTSDKTFDGAQQGVGRTLAGKTATINITGRAGVPNNATAVFLNVVAANPSRPGYLTVFPCGTKQPLASNVNYNGNDIRSNAVLAKIGTNGNVCVYTSADTDLIIDINGHIPGT